MASWTRGAPTETGFYYYHPRRAESQQHVWIMQVSETKGGELKFSAAQFGDCYTALIHRSLREVDGVWWGPLPNPGLPPE